MFKKELIDRILDGRKTTTRRRKQQAKVGDITNLMANKDYSKETGTNIQMTAVYPQKIGDMTNEDAIKEGFSDLNHFKEYWTKVIKEQCKSRQSCMGS